MLSMPKAWYSNTRVKERMPESDRASDDFTLHRKPVLDL